MNPGPKHLEIFLCASQEFGVGVFVTIASLIDHLSPVQETTIHLLGTSFDEKLLKHIESYLLQSGKPVRLDFQKIDLTVFSEIYETQKGNSQREFADDIYGRLLIPSLFPDVSFGIYLDSDMLIQKDLSELLALEDSATPLFAVKDYSIGSLSNPGEFIDCEKHNLDPDAPYFNSGFLVVNLKLWDRRDLIPSCISIGRQTKLNMPDQSILNIIFAEKWEPLESKWNHMCYPKSWTYAFPGSGVNYHFIGPNKPWFWPSRFAFGCVRKVHTYIKMIPIELINDYRPTKKPYPLFFVKSQLSQWIRTFFRLCILPFRRLAKVWCPPVAKSEK